jgi:hypothetical protein
MPSEKGVGTTLPSDGRGRAVARIDPQVVSQGKDLPDHPLNQSLMIASGEISPADGPGEEGVPGKDRTRGVKTYPSRRMSRGVNDLYPVSPQGDLLAVGKGPIRACPQSRRIKSMDEDRGLGDPAEFADSSYVVHVGVGDQDGDYFQTTPDDLLYDAQGLRPGIDHQPFPAFGMAKDVAIGLKGPDHYFFQHGVKRGP